MNVVSLRRTCTACPSAWEGITDTGCQVYIRYRWGTLTVRVGKEGFDYFDHPVLNVVDMDVLMDEKIGDPLDGLIKYDDMKQRVEMRCGDNLILPKREKKSSATNPKLWYNSRWYSTLADVFGQLFCVVLHKAYRVRGKNQENRGKIVCFQCLANRVRRFW